jgi:hypothetical protein
MIKHIRPDILAKVTMYLPCNGGKKEPIPPVQYGCPLSISGQLYDCRLLLDQLGLSLVPGETMNIPIKFLHRNILKDKLIVDVNFALWEMRYFAEGTILHVYE